VMVNWGCRAMLKPSVFRETRPRIVAPRDNGLARDGGACVGLVTRSIVFTDCYWSAT
jgi:hypothetical protein